jgi:tetratricopeptide (TPR) repeat protein
LASRGRRPAGLHHALGLTLVRLKRADEALGELRRAAYVYAVGLHAAARVDDAMAVLKESLARHPDDRDTLLALVTFSRDSGDVDAALEYTERLARIAPTDRDLAGLMEGLRRQAGKPTAQ